MAPVEKLIETVGKRTEQLSRDGRAIDYAKIEREIAELTAAVESATHRCMLGALVMDAVR